MSQACRRTATYYNGHILSQWRGARFDPTGLRPLNRLPKIDTVDYIQETNPVPNFVLAVTRDTTAVRLAQVMTSIKCHLSTALLVTCLTYFNSATASISAVTFTFITRKPCCRKETARCRSCCFWFKVRRQHSLQV